MKKQITKFLILTIILTAALSVNYLFAAWTGPTQAPPGGNTPTPIHVGSTEQLKDGALSLDALAVFGNGWFQGDITLSSLTDCASLATDANGKVICAPEETPEETYSQILIGNDNIGVQSGPVMTDMEITDTFPSSVNIEFSAEVNQVACYGGCSNYGWVALYVDGVEKAKRDISLVCDQSYPNACGQITYVQFDIIESPGLHTVEVKWARTGGSEPNPQIWQYGATSPRTLKIIGI